MKSHWTSGIKKCSDMIPHKVIDNSAETCEEMATATGISQSTAQRFASKMFKTGKWERVWKQCSKQLVPAYRIKRKH